MTTFYALSMQQGPQTPNSRGRGSERSPVFGVEEKTKVLDIFCSD